MKDKALAITSQLSLEKMFCCKFLWQKKKATSRLREPYRLKERQTEVKITYLYIPLYLYLPYLYPNISGLTLVLNTCGIKHTHTHTFSLRITAYIDHCFVIQRSKHLLLYSNKIIYLFKKVEGKFQLAGSNCLQARNISTYTVSQEKSESSPFATRQLMSPLSFILYNNFVHVSCSVLSNGRVILGGNCCVR